MSKRPNKDEWVEMFREAGLDDLAMKKWHQLFEKHYPEGHADFLHWLGLSPAEIAGIRANSL